jgi:hypothetical protein
MNMTLADLGARADRCDIAPSRSARLDRDGYFTIDANWIVPTLCRVVPVEGPIFEPCAGRGPGIDRAYCGLAVWRLAGTSAEQYVAGRRMMSRSTLRPGLVKSVSLTIAPASSSSVQRARPSGGLEQAVAMRRASSLLVSLRSAPARGSSFRAASRLPLTKRSACSGTQAA